MRDWASAYVSAARLQMMLLVKLVLTTWQWGQCGWWGLGS